MRAYASRSPVVRDPSSRQRAIPFPASQPRSAQMSCSSQEKAAPSFCISRTFSSSSSGLFSIFHVRWRGRQREACISRSAASVIPAYRPNRRRVPAASSSALWVPVKGRRHSFQRVPSSPRRSGIGRESGISSAKQVLHQVSLFIRLGFLRSLLPTAFCCPPASFWSFRRTDA